MRGINSNKFLNLRNEFFLLYFLSATAIVDCINGFLLSNYGDASISVGQIYRLLLIMLGITYIIKFYKKSVYNSFLIISSIYFIANTLFTYFFHYKLKVLLSDLIYASKALLPIIVISACYLAYREKIINKRTIEKVIKFNIYFVPFSLIILKVFNLGMTAYDNAGFKGYYFSNNEINVVLCILFIFSWDNLYKRIKIRNYKEILIASLVLIYVFIPMLLIGSKTSIIVGLAVSILYIINVIRISKRPYLTLSIILAIILISICLLSVVFRNEINGIIMRQRYFAGRFDYLTFLLSYRNIYFIELWNTLKSNVGIFTILFGFRRTVNTLQTTFMYIELDILNVFINYGIIGVVCLYGFYLKVFYDSFHRKVKDIFPYRLSFVVVMLFSTFAGHVMFSALAGTFLAIVSIPQIMEGNSDKG